MDRIARIGHQHDVAGRGDRLRHVGEAFLGAERGDDLRFRIELHAEAALVILRLRQAQARNAARGRIAVGARLAERLLDLLDDMRWRRQIRIAHAEIDDVRPRIAGARLGPVHLFKHIGRQAADAVKFFHSLKPLSRPPIPAGWHDPGRLLSRVGLGAILRAAGGLAGVGVSGFFFAGFPVFLAVPSRASWRSRTAESSFSMLNCCSSVKVGAMRGGGMSWTAGY